MAAPLYALCSGGRLGDPCTDTPIDLIVTRSHRRAKALFQPPLVPIARRVRATPLARSMMLTTRPCAETSVNKNGLFAE